MTLIDDLRAKKENLTESLNACTDEATYDKVDVELRETSKRLTLAENQERQRQADEAAAKRKAEVDGFNAEVKRITKAKKETDALDSDLFEKIHTVYDAFSKAYDSRMRILQETKQLKFRAEELELDAPPSVTLSVCNFSDNQGDKQDFFVALITQYDNAIRALNGAHKRNEKGIPDRPGIHWYTKGSGQFYPGEEDCFTKQIQEKKV